MLAIAQLFSLRFARYQNYHLRFARYVFQCVVVFVQFFYFYRASRSILRVLNNGIIFLRASRGMAKMKVSVNVNATVNVNVKVKVKVKVKLKVNVNVDMKESVNVNVDVKVKVNNEQRTDAPPNLSVPYSPPPTLSRHTPVPPVHACRPRPGR